MSVSNELSSEIAAAILLVAQDKSPRELTNLTEMMVKVHSVLQELVQEERTARYQARFERGRTSPVFD
jgi:hypothetical protein